jgi:hypothetical protein
MEHKIDLILKYIIIKELDNYYMQEYTEANKRYKSGIIEELELKNYQMNSLETNKQLRLILDQIKEISYGK